MDCLFLMEPFSVHQEGPANRNIGIENFDRDCKFQMEIEIFKLGLKFSIGIELFRSQGPLRKGPNERYQTLGQRNQGSG